MYRFTKYSTVVNTNEVDWVSECDLYMNDIFFYTVLPHTPVTAPFISMSLCWVDPFFLLEAQVIRTPSIERLELPRVMRTKSYRSWQSQVTVLSLGPLRGRRAATISSLAAIRHTLRAWWVKLNPCPMPSPLGRIRYRKDLYQYHGGNYRANLGHAFILLAAIP